jgi:hypothetical protein
VTLFFVRSAFILSLSVDSLVEVRVGVGEPQFLLQKIRPHALHFSLVRERYERRVPALQGNPTAATSRVRCSRNSISD